MNLLMLYFFIAIGLSMDAFSLSIVYGMNNIVKKDCISIGIIVGLFHFIMPNIGGFIGRKIMNGLIQYSNLLTGIVFLFLAIQMSFSLKEDENIKNISGIISKLLFAFAVSLDSFSVGFALSYTNKFIYGCFIFSFVSFLFTISGLYLGNVIGKKIGNLSKIIGIFILLTLSCKYLILI